MSASNALNAATARPPLTARAPGGPRKPGIRRTRAVSVSTMSDDEREQLVGALYPIYRESFTGFDRGTFARAILFRDPRARLGLYYGTDEKLAGFSSIKLERLEFDGRAHGVLHAGTYISERYRGGAASIRFGLREALRCKLRHPLTPLWYLAEMTNPAPYRLLARSMAVVYPHPDVPAPPVVVALTRAVAKLRGMRFDPARGPWVARYEHAARGARSAGARGSATLRDDRYVRYYMSLNPEFAAGDDLLTCIPLDASNILAGLVPALRRPIRARRASTRR